jgi:hypothetical protein
MAMNGKAASEGIFSSRKLKMCVEKEKDRVVGQTIHRPEG